MQIALSYVLLAGAGMLLTRFVALQSAKTGYNMQVLALDVPMPLDAGNTQVTDFFRESMRRISRLPEVKGVAVGAFVPWRDAGSFGAGFGLAAEGYTPAAGEENPRARLRAVAPGFFGVLGVPMLAGRDFTAEDRRGSERVAIVSQAVAQRLFPEGNAVNGKLWWTDPYFGKPAPRRIVGVVADVDDEHVVAHPALTVYHPFEQLPVGGRLFVHAAGDPYALVAPVTRIIRALSKDQPVARAATLADVRASVLTPERLNAFVLSGFAGVALLIAAVGVAGVLAFSVSARTREFGLRLAVGSTPRDLLVQVMAEGGLIVAFGLVTGAAGGGALGLAAASYFDHVRLPGLVPVLGATAIIAGAGILASLMPAARASRVDVLQALRSE
jgi:putative ABC transport system permease protein